MKKTHTMLKRAKPLNAYALTTVVVAVVVGAFVLLRFVVASQSTSFSSVQPWAAAFQGYPPSQAGDPATTAANDASHFNLIVDNDGKNYAGVGTKYTAAARTAMKAINPNLKFLVYLNGSAKNSGDSGPNGDNSGTYAESAYAHNKQGNRIFDGKFGDYMMNARSPIWIKSRVDKCQWMITNRGYDGCLYDSIGTGALAVTASGGGDNSMLDTNTGAYFTAAGWVNAELNMTGSVKTATGKLVFGNCLASGNTFYGPAPSSAYVNPAKIDGVMAETYLRPGRSSNLAYPSIGEWKNSVNMMYDAAAAGITLMTETKLWSTTNEQTTLQGTPQERSQWERFALGTYMLGSYGKSYFTFTYRRSGSGPTQYAASPLSYTALKDLNVNIGTPAAKYVQAGNCYIRRYTKGVVVVNPNTTGCTYALGGSYTDLDGHSTATATLAANTAQVFSGGVTMTPTPTPTPVVTPTPSSTPTPSPTGSPSPTPTPSPVAVLGDVNGDGVVDVADLSVIVNQWNTTFAAADLDHNGIVGIGDVSVLVANFGQSLDTVPPTAPTALTGSALTSTSALLNWQASTDAVGVASYVISRNGLAIATVPGTTLTYTDTTAPSGGSPVYTVRAVDAAANSSAASNSVTVALPAPTADTQPPSVPGGVTVTAVSSTQLNVSWIASTDNVGVTAYRVIRGGVLVGTVAAGTSFGDTGLTPSTSYSYTVTAVDAANNASITSVTVTGKTLAGGTPTPTPTPSPTKTPTPTPTPSPTPTPTTVSGANATTPCGVTATAPATYQHVIWVIMENHFITDVINNAAAPYMTSLAKKCGYDTAWFDAGKTFKSLPNYMTLTSGGMQGVTTDGAPSNFPPVTADNIFRQVRSVGKTSRTYEESMGANCTLTGGSPYAVRHNPAAFYVGGTDRAACLKDNVDMGTATSGNLFNDLKNNTMANFSVIVPNTCNDTHSCTTQVGDAYLKALMPVILNSSTYTAGNTAVVILYDENGPIPNMIISPSVHPGTVSGTTINHTSLLRATEDMMGITTHLGGAATAPNMRPIFNW